MYEKLFGTNNHYFENLSHVAQITAAGFAIWAVLGPIDDLAKDARVNKHLAHKYIIEKLVLRMERTCVEGIKPGQRNRSDNYDPLHANFSECINETFRTQNFSKLDKVDQIELKLALSSLPNQLEIMQRNAVKRIETDPENESQIRKKFVEEVYAGIKKLELITNGGAS